jgi:hypothetical protein
MRRLRIESESPEPIAGFVAGVEWVNDSAIAVVRVDTTNATPFAVLEDRDGEGEDGILRLTVDGTREGSA